MLFRLFLLSALLAAAPHAQPAERAPAPRVGVPKALTQWARTAWNVEDGLPQSSVRAVTQTADGYLWLGTQEGLARYDGAAFEEFSPRTHPDLPDGYVQDLAADPAGGLWVGTRDGGLFHLGPHGAVTTFGPADGLPPTTVGAVAVDAAGHVWVGTREGLCVRAPGAAFTCTAAGLPDPYVRTLVVREDGVWVGTAAGLLRFDGRAFHALGTDAAVITLAPRAAGGVWVGTEDGIAFLDGGRLAVPPGAEALRGQTVMALHEDDTGQLWIGMAGAGLARLHRGRLHRLTEAQGLPSAAVRALWVDREGSLWVGLDAGGLLQLRDAPFTPFGALERLPHDVTWAVSQAPDGTVWAATDGGLAALRPDGSARTFTRADDFPAAAVNTVLAASDGSVWAGTDGAGLVRLVEGRVARVYGVRDGLPDPYVLSLYEGPGGALWAGTDGGLARWDGERFVGLGVPDFPAAPVLALAEGGGALWVGTYGAGLLRVRGAEVTAFTPEDGFPHDVVLSLWPRADGGVWAGTAGGGLALVDARGRTGVVTGRHGLPTETVTWAAEDARGDLWLTTSRGVLRAPARAVAAVAAGDAPAVDFRLYDRHDGLRSAEANGGVQPAGWLGRDGRVWVPTVAGVAVLDPADDHGNPLPPLVDVARLLVNGAPLALGGPVRLEPGASEIELDYAALSFVAPDRVRFRYRLDGRDDGWRDAGGRRAAFYTDLPPGTYTFRVQAANADGVWSPEGAALTFTLRPHFYQTAWFAALCALLAGLAAWGAYHLRTRALRERARVLEQTVQERTHQLAEEKQRVEGLAGELAELNRDLERKVREQLEQIMRGSRLRKFFPKKVVDRILGADEEVRVSAERRTVTAFFSDLVGFTTFAEATPPDTVTRVLNDYLTEMVALIEVHGGTLDKFMGDGIMALFGAADEMPPEQQAEQAVRMGLAMQRAMGRLREGWAADGLDLPLAVRMGVHQSEVTVGNFGSDDLVEFTAIGRGVNLASRLEGACPPGGLLVSFPVYALTQDHFAYGAPEAKTLKGLPEPVPAYPLDPAAQPAEPESSPESGPEAEPRVAAVT